MAIDESFVPAGASGQEGDSDLRERALKRLRKKSDFRVHLLIYLAVNAFVVVIWAWTGSGFFWPVFLIFAWGDRRRGERVGRLSPGAVLRGADPTRDRPPAAVSARDVRPVKRRHGPMVIGLRRSPGEQERRWPLGAARRISLVMPDEGCHVGVGSN